MRGHQDSSISVSVNLAALEAAPPISPWTIRPGREALLTAGVILLVIASAVVGLTAAALRAVETESREGLLAAGPVVAALIDPAAHAALVESPSPTVADYDRLNGPLRRIREAGAGYSAISTLIRKPTAGRDTLYVVLDADRTGDQLDLDHNGRLSDHELLTPYDMGPYYDDPDTVRQALIQGRAIPTEAPFTDSFGTFSSVFHPLILDGRTVAAISLDVDAHPALARRNRLITTAGILLLFGLAVAIGTGVALFRTRRNERMLAQQRHQAITSLRKARDRAQAGDHAKVSFLAMMSHELRTPLNGILGMNDLLLTSTPLTTDQREMGETVQHCGKHLLALVNDLLDMAALENGPIPVRPREFHPEAPLTALLEVHGPSAESKGLTLVLSCDAGLPRRALGDPDRLRQLLSPLVANALKFTTTGHIRLAVAWAAGMLEYRIEDTGPGIPAEQRSRLFRPFEQGEDYLSRQHGGSGLGLALAGRLAQALGAQLTLEEGPGSRLVVRLPSTALAPPHTFPAPGSQGTVRVEHPVEALRQSLEADAACLGYAPVPAHHEGTIPDLLLVDGASLSRGLVTAEDLAHHAKRVIVLLTPVEALRLQAVLAEHGLHGLHLPATRTELAQVLSRSTGSLSALLPALGR